MGPVLDMTGQRPRWRPRWAVERAIERRAATDALTFAQRQVDDPGRPLRDRDGPSPADLVRSRIGAPSGPDEESHLLADWPETARYDMTVPPTVDAPNPPIDWPATRAAVRARDLGRGTLPW